MKGKLEMPILSWFRKKKVLPLSQAKMSYQERNVILLFASGYVTLKDSAIKIHRLYLHDLNTPEQLFMREVDNPCPDLALRAIYREQLLAGRKKEA